MAESNITEWRQLTKNSKAQLSIQGLLMADPDFYVVTTNVGSTENYATGGIAVDLSGSKKRRLIIPISISISTGHVGYYDATNKKIKVFKNATEVANNATTLRSAVIKTTVVAV